jgi:hypothetical protein
VLVHGDATTEELTGDPPWSYELLKTNVMRQPDSRKYLANPVARYLFLFYYQRIGIYVHPRRLLIWPHRDFSASPTKIEMNAEDAQPADQPPGKQDTSAPAQRAWNQELVARARVYPSGVLTIVEPSGYPVSVRCTAQFDDERHVVTLSGLPKKVPGGWQGKACLLFHRHSQGLEEQYELLIKGELSSEDGTLVLRNCEFITGSGSQTNDRMPHAGAPRELIQFMMLGRRKARDYIAKRGEPWPPRPFKKMVRYLDVGPTALEEK